MGFSFDFPSKLEVLDLKKNKQKQTKTTKINTLSLDSTRSTRQLALQNWDPPPGVDVISMQVPPIWFLVSTLKDKAVSL